MPFDPLAASKSIVDSYHDYVESTFYMRDDDFRMQFRKILDENKFAKGPFIDCIDAFKTGSTLNELVNQGLLSKEFQILLQNEKTILDRSLYMHQERAIRQALKDHNLVVTTGTGSGKTESFLYPLLQHLFRQKELQGGIPDGVHALLLYPMNALANDQMIRLRELLRAYPEITFGAYTGETEGSQSAAQKRYKELFNKEPLVNELISRDQMKERPPHILITNYAMLEYLLLRPEDNVFFHGQYAQSWKYLVLDEAHTYSGATGMEVSLLLRRLQMALPNPDQLRCILTSATLGDEEKNPAILRFAHNLTGKDFLPEDIVRAERLAYQRPDDCSQHGPELIDFAYAAVTDSRDSALSILRQRYGDISASDNLQEYLYGLLGDEALYHDCRAELQSSDHTIESLSSSLGIDQATLQKLVSLASFAHRNDSKLLDARYHQFVRTLEGAYVTFRPEKTLTVEPRNEADFNGELYLCFKINVCQYCGELYLEGRINEHRLDQSRRKNGQYFMVINQEFISQRGDEQDYDDFEQRVYTLCCKCGSMAKKSAITSQGKCGCSTNDKILVFEISKKEEHDELHKCGFCLATNPRGSVLRGFYVGQNAAAAVIGSALYEAMPPRSIKLRQEVRTMGKQKIQEIEKETKQLLVFSDSRQEAAFFAPYFEFTYENIKRRRIIMQAANLLGTQHYKNEGIPLQSLVKQIMRIMEDHDMYAREDREREAWKSVLYEMRAGDRNGLVNLGLLSFDYDSVFDEGYAPFDDAEELRQVDSALMQSFLKEGAVFCPANLNADDMRSIMYHERKVGIAEGPKPSEDTGRSAIETKYWIAQYNNSRMDFLRRTGRFQSDEDIKEFLHEHFVSKPKHNTGQELKLAGGSAYQLLPQKIHVRVTDVHKLQWYQCNTCARLTRHNVGKVCPQYRCEGVLVPLDTRNLKNYHRNRLLDETLFPMAVKEHTAQLNHNTAREYQNKFIAGDIQVLSSSTTFEMGVDVGELETVFMRNMPPTPANYIQRAGRAGRRSDSAAFALTFCRLMNHDLAYFKNPQNMINGSITPPVFKLDNKKIVSRHIYAALLAAFWRSFPFAKDLRSFFTDEVVSAYYAFLENPPAETMVYIRSFVPGSFSDKKIQDCIQEYRTKRFADTLEYYRQELESIRRLSEEHIQAKKYAPLKGLQYAQETLETTQIISFFSRNNLIPKYGFPVDTVELRANLAAINQFKDVNAKLRLQRDLIQAISDYAPGSEVIADGKMYTSRYIRKPFQKDKTWRQYQYGICTNSKCEAMQIQRVYSDQLERETHVCDHCGTEYAPKGSFLVPDYGFIVANEEPSVVTTQTPRKTGRTQIYYVGDGLQRNTDVQQRYSLGTEQITITSSENDQLAVVNRSAFYVCNACGYAEVSKIFTKTKRKKHKGPGGRQCINETLKQKSIGHTFRTDVAVITVGRYIRDEAHSILYGFLEGMARYFEIERNDIDGCVSRRKKANEQWVTDFILFDKVPGGAGNANRLAKTDEAQFKDFLKDCYKVAAECTCGDNGDGNAACYSCLCNYGNQWYHDVLKRKHVMEFIGEMIL